MNKIIYYLSLVWIISNTSFSVEWNDLTILQQNREASRATMMVYQDEKKSIKLR